MLHGMFDTSVLTTKVSVNVNTDVPPYHNGSRRFIRNTFATLFD